MTHTHTIYFIKPQNVCSKIFPDKHNYLKSNVEFATPKMFMTLLFSNKKTCRLCHPTDIILFGMATRPFGTQKSSIMVYDHGEYTHTIWIAIQECVT